ncbi:hypothetical protein BJ138DRAFT_1172144 [Hygrophoropsis aurantiaca]|uniref:Uncharacterized protein n=1 Tax=Hygrophoropsis aurantiaca TaxID=72124 RepID=A0ACB8AET8_9AGAM|nr:hypothetical protein BJ138DRAFT_1172144 [Hygrophoropsis aurantiaca]
MQSIYSSQNPNLARYVVQSSDVISDLRINILEEGSDKVMWYKERFLSDEEIIEHVVHNQTSTICWTIHRPKRGWYIRIRSPSFPPGTSISLLPVPRASPGYVDAALSFACRTNVFSSASPYSPGTSPKTSTDSTLTDITAVHSYPPTPPVAPITVTPPSPDTIKTKLDEIDVSPPAAAKKRKSRVPPTKVTHFMLAPHSTPHIPGPQPGDQTSFFTRALSAFRNHKPSHSSSFTLCPIAPAIPQPSGSDSTSQPRKRLSHLIPLAPSPLLTFHDQTPVLTVRSITGLLEIDRAEERMLGIETSFWIAIALTYLEFLEERESYLAALAD